jgi:hypothetical protein
MQMNRVINYLSAQVERCTCRIEDGNIGFVYVNNEEWFRFRLVSNPYAPHGHTITIWGPRNEAKMDTEAGLATVMGDVMGFSNLDEEAHARRLARKYFVNCGYVSESDDE